MRLFYIFIFVFCFQFSLFSQKYVNWIIIIDGYIPTYILNGELTFFYNNEKIKIECSYSIGRLLINDTNSEKILNELPDTTSINVILNYYYFKRSKFIDNLEERIEQQYTFHMWKVDLLESGFLIIAITNNKDKTYEIACKSDEWTNVSWNSKKMKKNRKIFYNFH